MNDHDHHDDAPSPHPRLLLAAVLGALTLLALGLAAVLALQHYGTQPGKVKCSNNLRQIGLASIHYTNDKRFFPHLGPIRTPDGGLRTNQTTVTIRALMWYGYLDNPEGFLCPQSTETYIPITDPSVRDNLETWFWDGAHGTGDPTTNPFLDARDPTLLDCLELSFGWTRKGLGASARSTQPLGADRSPEAHGGYNVLFADGAVSYLARDDEAAARLGRAAGPRDGFLSITPPDSPQ